MRATAKTILQAAQSKTILAISRRSHLTLASSPLKLALSMLCENSRRRTGLTTLGYALVAAARAQFPDTRWLVFSGADQQWEEGDPGVEVVRNFPANDRRLARLWVDHFRVGPAARSRGAAALLTFGFVPFRTGGLPVAMHVLSVRHRSTLGGPGAWYRRFALRSGSHRASLVIANSRWTAAQIGRVRSPVLVSHEGVDHNRFRPDAPAGDALPPNWPREYVLWASNFYSYKRAPLAIAAYARLAPEVRRRFPFVLVGGDWAGGRAAAEAAARRAGVSRDVFFAGWIADTSLPAAYRGARVHVLPTAEETFGRSVLDAMACGCPCLVQDLPVLREVAGKAANFVDFEDPGASSAALARICLDDAHAVALRAAGLIRAQDFSFSKLARERVSAVLEIAFSQREEG